MLKYNNVNLTKIIKSSRKQKSNQFFLFFFANLAFYSKPTLTILISPFIKARTILSLTYPADKTPP